MFSGISYREMELWFDGDRETGMKGLNGDGEGRWW